MTNRILPGGFRGKGIPARGKGVSEATEMGHRPLPALLGGPAGEAPLCHLGRGPWEGSRCTVEPLRGRMLAPPDCQGGQWWWVAEPLLLAVSGIQARAPSRQTWEQGCGQGGEDTLSHNLQSF